MSCQTDLTLNCPQPGNGAKASFALWTTGYQGTGTGVNCFGEVDFLVAPTKGLLTVALDLGGGDGSFPGAHPCGGQGAVIALSIAEDGDGGNYTVQNLILPGVSSAGQAMSGPVVALQ